MEPTLRQLRAKRRREAAAGGLQVALLGLGLLCVLQATLNVGLRLYGVRCNERCPDDDPSTTPGSEPTTTAESDATETYQTSQYTSASFTAEDPCTSSHRDFCVHGRCHFLKDLDKPVCECEEPYTGERCLILKLDAGLGY